jgi:hypothetical protein
VPNEICDAANITFAPIMCANMTEKCQIKSKSLCEIINENKNKKLQGTCIVGCITNFVRFIITRESPCIYIYTG